MTRREFLKALAGAAFYLTAGTLFTRRRVPSAYDAAADTTAPEVARVRSKDYVRAVEEAVSSLGGMDRYVRPGDIVVVKPNIAWNSPPHLKANTDPVVVRTVVDLCFKAMAQKVYVFDRATSNPKLSYVTSGILDAAREAGAKVLYVNDVTKKLYPEISIKDAVFLKSTTVNRYILESDVLINVPVAKHHSSAGLTIGMKNLMGITGDNRSRWHWELHEAISDISLGVKSTLTVVDATNIMLRNGPTGGRKEYLRQLDTVIASGDVVSADAEAAKLFGRDPESIEHIFLASKKGIGKIKGYTVGIGTV